MLLWCVVGMGLLADTVHAVLPVIIASILPKLIEKVVKKKVEGAMTQMSKTSPGDTANQPSGVIALDDLDPSLVQMVNPHAFPMLSEDLERQARGQLKALDQFFVFKTRPAEDTSRLVNELLGQYIVLNEADAAAAQVLFSLAPCPLSSLLDRRKTDGSPCSQPAGDMFVRIVERLREVHRVEKQYGGDKIQFPVEWRRHVQLLIASLDRFSDHLQRRDQKAFSAWGHVKTDMAQHVL